MNTCWAIRDNEQNQILLTLSRKFWQLLGKFLHHASRTGNLVYSIFVPLETRLRHTAILLKHSPSHLSWNNFQNLDISLQELRLW